MNPVDPNPNTIEGIMAFLKRAIQERHPLHPGIYLDEAHKLSVLLEDVDDRLLEAEMEYRGLRSAFIEAGDSAASAEVRAKASGAYKEFRKLQSLRERVFSVIQISKQRTNLRQSDQ